MNYLCMLFLTLATAASPAMAAESALMGSWQVLERGVDSANNPCPFVPDTIEFFRDGTVSMTNMPQGMKMLYKTALSPEEAKAVMAKFPYLKDKDHILLMMPATQADWANNSIAYDYAVKGRIFTMTLPGWAPSTFKRK